MPLLKQLRRACGRATPALLVPRGRSLGGAVAEVEVSPGEQLGVEDVGWIAGRIAEECGVGDDVEPWRFATEEAPLVLSVARGEAWYGRVRLLLTENQLAMFFALAKGEGVDEVRGAREEDRAGGGPPGSDRAEGAADSCGRDRGELRGGRGRMPEGLGERIVAFSRSQGYRLGVGAIVR